MGVLQGSEKEETDVVERRIQKKGSSGLGEHWGRAAGRRERWREHPHRAMGSKTQKQGHGDHISRRA